jgi:hypothetical protein
MCGWKANEHIDFDFADYQLDDSIKSKDSYYIKSVCRDKIRLASTLILLIGSDTRFKTNYVKDEVEVAIEKGCRLIGMNLSGWRRRDSLCPAFFAGKGALFIPYSPHIAELALRPWSRPIQSADDYHFEDSVYARVGYALDGETAVWPKQKKPWEK